MLLLTPQGSGAHDTHFHTVTRRLVAVSQRQVRIRTGQVRYIVSPVTSGSTQQEDQGDLSAPGPSPSLLRTNEGSAPKTTPTRYIIYRHINHHHLLLRPPHHALLLPSVTYTLTHVPRRSDSYMHPLFTYIHAHVYYVACGAPLIEPRHQPGVMQCRASLWVWGRTASS